MPMKCPDCHTRIVFGTEHLGGCRYLGLAPAELKRVVAREAIKELAKSGRGDDLV